MMICRPTTRIDYLLAHMVRMNAGGERRGDARNSAARAAPREAIPLSAGEKM